MTGVKCQHLEIFGVVSMAPMSLLMFLLLNVRPTRIEKVKFHKMYLQAVAWICTSFMFAPGGKGQPMMPEYWKMLNLMVFQEKKMHCILQMLDMD